MWRHIAESLQGPSHVADGTGCQDRHSVCVVGDSTTSTLVACVADGAGSAKFSEAGSAIACETIVENAKAHFYAHGRLDELEKDVVLRWCQDARERIWAAAVERNCEARQLATTLCGVVAGPQSSTFFQIGDGAIILRTHGVYGVVFWPQSGEYANSTNFLTADDYREQLVFLTTPSVCSEVALFTDGLERLALRFDHQTPHPPFFDPLFRALQSADDVQGLS